MLRIIFIIILTFGWINSYNQIFNRAINEYDENGKRKGLWTAYWDEEDKIPMSRAKFKDGYEINVSKEYHQNGKLRLKFRYYKNRLRVKHYNQNGQLEAKGWAHLEYNKQDSRFYFHGKWKYYDERRKLIRIGWYENGHEITK